jgi:hypothetical protein
VLLSRSLRDRASIMLDCSCQVVKRSMTSARYSFSERQGLSFAKILADFGINNIAAVVSTIVLL